MQRVWGKTARGGGAHDCRSALIVDIMTYIVSNGFYLIDVTGALARWLLRWDSQVLLLLVAGKPTTFGQWAPAVLNGMRSWSDGRGVNSLQVRHSGAGLRELSH